MKYVTCDRTVVESKIVADGRERENEQRGRGVRRSGGTLETGSATMRPGNTGVGREGGGEEGVISVK